MPFLEDKEWDPIFIQLLLSTKQSIRPTKGQFNGPYIKLLNYTCEGIGLVITPLDDDQSVDSGLLIGFYNNQLLVLVTVIDISTELQSSQEREAADCVMRDIFFNTLSKCPLTMMYGLSFASTKLRVYEGDMVKQEIHPPLEKFVRGTRGYLADTWNVDMTSTAGLKKLQSVILDIKKRLEDSGFEDVVRSSKSC